MKPYVPIFIKEPTNNFSNYLLEHTFDIDNDIDVIYDKSQFNYFVDFFKNFNENVFEVLPDNIIDIIKNKKDIILGELSSKILKTKEAKKAHEINPVKIRLGIFIGESFYQPNKNLIQISLNYDALQTLANYQTYGIDIIQQILKKSDFKIFQRQLTKPVLKAKISHEISHWIHDTLFNRDIKKLVDLTIKLNDQEVLLLKQKDVNMTYFEIDAQIHAIKQVKKLLKDRYDEITMTDLFFEYPALKAVFEFLYTNYKEKVANIWVRNLIKRMDRENLLGKNMQQFPDFSKLTESLFRI